MLAALRSLWNEPRPPDPPPWTWRDLVLVGVLVPAAVLEGFLRPDLPWRVVSVAVAVGLVPTLLWRRTRPLLMIVICFAVTGLAPLLMGEPPSEMYTMAYQLILPYALFRWGSGREAATGLAIMIVSASLSAVTGRTAGPDVIGAFTALSATAALGGAFRYRSRARSRELDQVKLLEREQLARDLHDTVAHHVSAMAVRAQAGLATAESRPEAATEALRVIEAEAARALDEMHALVRVLRRDRPDEPADLAPGRRITDIERLAGRSRSGPAVDVEISGDLGGLPPSVEAAVYRLAQESVTNAVRHARHATRVEVRVTADDTSVRLRVSDDGDGGLVRPAASPGYGIIGMIERAHLLRGTCTAGPGPDRGWTVSAVLPRTGAAT
ncbi:two-component sensor histidine kinase [Planomonospora parontospora subsp. parontospora]|uniref:histidine kinase n=2 Tax=Planomonospora parontospora TaxID=58119 RepID=A0AA37BN05_9ACTN|nr:sensor histidine kinase [Planomonospora parontospora]GGK95035.1 two-component sensor histidine kinase [Planomonospora parontospora]GII12506.1 two-component sensor histidine kinase [Planomonospora parontospora subsp. parontospora]